MPVLQQFDFREKPPEESGVAKFFSGLQQSYKNKQDEDTLGNLLKQYEQNRDQANAFEQLQLNLEKSNINPTKRLQTQEQLNKIRKNTIDTDRILNDNAKVLLEQRQKEAELKSKEDIEKQKIELGKEKNEILRKEKENKLIKDQKEAEAILLESGADPQTALEKSQNLSPESAKALINRKKEGDEYSKLREKSISEYVNTKLEQGDLAKSQEVALDEAEKAINGEITGPGFTALLKNNPYAQLVMGLTPDEALLQATNKKILEGSTGVFGAKPTEREIFLLLNEMLPSIGKTKEANLAGMGFLRKLNQLKIAESEVVDRLTNSGSKYVPDLQSQVQKQMKPLLDAYKSELTQAVEKQRMENEPKMKVKAPDGTQWNMTQSQINNAKKQGVIFEPVK